MNSRMRSKTITGDEDSLTRSRWYNTAYLIIVFILVMGFVSAEQNLGIFKQNTCISLKQTCANCTFVNISSVIAPDSDEMIRNVVMTKLGTDYNYTFCNTTDLGEYIYNTIGDVNGLLVTQPVSFQINPSGNQSPLGLFIIVIVAMYAIGFIGFFGRNQWVSALGGLSMIALGLYTINSGIDIYRTFITDVFSWTTIGIGALFVLVPLVEMIQDNL